MSGLWINGQIVSVLPTEELQAAITMAHNGYDCMVCGRPSRSAIEPSVIVLIRAAGSGEAEIRLAHLKCDASRIQDLPSEP